MLIKNLNDWSHDLKIKSEAVSLEWEEFQDNNLRLFVSKIEKTLSILESKENMGNDLF